MANPIADELALTSTGDDGDEARLLLWALDRVRWQFAWKTGGLDTAALRRTHPPSTLTLAGLVKHLAAIEDRVAAVDLEGRAPGPPWDVDWAAYDWEWDWRTAGDDEAEELYALWRGAVERNRTAWAAALEREGGLSQPSLSGRTDDAGQSPTLRRVLVDQLEEYLRHTGHADLLREAVDGLVGNDPPMPSRDA